MSCRACGQHLPAEAAFCFSCGAAVVAPGCESCGAELVPGAAFCFKCGARVPEAGATGAAGGHAGRGTAPIVAAPVSERRLTSVLFADLVSYTTISESRDTEDVRELLSQYFDVCSTVVRRHGGVVEKFIGDAVMAVWGVPTAHEDDAERAVRAALELVTAVSELGERLELRQLAARAGVVTGEVAANLAAADQGMVAGDPVNTAARVQSAAGSGQVWVDDATRNLTSAAVTYADVGLHPLKGKAEPVQLYRAGTVVATIGGQQRVDGLEAPLMGRDRELRLIKDLFHATEESGRPRLVVVDGEAGVGKSRLGWEFFKYIDGLSRFTAWHRGRCPSYGEGVVFWALNEAVRARLGLVEEDAGAAVVDALDRFLAERVTEEDERSWLRPRMASLLGEEAREFSREDLFGAWTRFFDRVGGGDPVVLLIEDAQHADDGLLAFVEHLVASSTIGCFVLLLARPELMETHPQLGGRRATVVRVEPLPGAAMRGLVAGLVDDLPDEVRQALVARAEGIPLYAVETVRALIDRDLVTPQGGRYAVAPGVRIDLSTIGAPESLHALVAARLDALAVEERLVLTSASVLGQTFTREGIALLADGVGELDDVLARLQRKELLSSEVDRFSAERGQFRFVQSVVQQVAYSTLSRRERKSRHLLVADHFAADVEHAEELAQVIARHLLDAAEAAGPADHDVPTLRARARDLLVRAGDRAAGLSAHLDALRCYQHALGCEPPPDITAQILRRSARSHLQLEQGEEAGTAAQRAMEICQETGDVVGAAESAALVADVLAQRFRHDEALEVARAHLELLRGLEDGLPAFCALTVEVARSLCFLGRYAESAVPINEALHIAEQIGDIRSIQRAANALAQMQAAVGSRHLARLLFDDMARQARLNDDWPGLNTALGNTALLVSQSDLTAALELTLEADRVRTEHGMPVAETSQMNALRWQWLAGQWGAVQERLAEILGTENASPLLRLGGAAVADLCSWSGRSAPAPVTLPEEDQAPALRTTVEFVAGTSALRSGDVPRAVRHLRAAVDAEVGLSGYWDDFHVVWPIAFRLALEVGDIEAVAALWAHHEEAGQAGPSSNLCGHTKVFEALLELHEAQPDRGRAEQLLRDGIEILDKCGVVVWRAHAQEDLGRLLLAQGLAEDAQPHLEAARRAYAELGATSWLARVPSAARVG